MKNIKIDEDKFMKMKPGTAFAYVCSLLFPEKNMREIARLTGVTYKRVRLAFSSSKENNPASHESRRPQKIYEKYKEEWPCTRYRNLLYSQLAEYVGRYPKDMLAEFENYWNEPNDSKTLCRWKMQKTFYLPGRLSQWSKRSNEHNKNFGRENVSNKNFTEF